MSDNSYLICIVSAITECAEAACPSAETECHVSGAAGDPPQCNHTKGPLFVLEISQEHGFPCSPDAEKP